jgi:hypothetical protein
LARIDELGIKAIWSATARVPTPTERRPISLDGRGPARVVPGFEGVAVHDGWAPYRNYDGCDHGLCNIHHLRELEAAAEAGHGWPVAMSCLLIGHQGSR